METLALIPFISANERLIRFIRHGILLLLVVTAAAWIMSYFYCSGLNVGPWRGSATKREDTLSVCTLYGRIYCFHSNLLSFGYSGTRRIHGVNFSTMHYRIYFRRSSLKNPWAEFMGYPVVYFTIPFWAVLCTEFLLWITISLLLRRANR